MKILFTVQIEPILKHVPFLQIIVDNCPLKDGTGNGTWDLRKHTSDGRGHFKVFVQLAVGKSTVLLIRNGPLVDKYYINRVSLSQNDIP